LFIVTLLIFLINRETVHSLKYLSSNFLLAYSLLYSAIPLELILIVVAYAHCHSIAENIIIGMKMEA